MEESEKRRERLNAMRMEAAQTDVNTEVENFTQTQGLSNPLIETSTTNQDSHTPQRFGYYTDPMAAFSGNKRSKVSQNFSQEHVTPTMQQKIVMGPPHELPSQIIHQPHEPVWSPRGTAYPSGVQPGTPGGAWSGSGYALAYNVPSNSPRGATFPNPAISGFGQGGGPIISPGQGQGQWFSNSPGAYSGQWGIPGFGHQGGPGFNPAEGRGYWSNNNQTPGSVHGGSPGFGRGARPNYNSGQGREYGSNNSLSPGPGHGSSPSIGQGGRPNFNSAQGRESWPRNSHTRGSYGPNLGRGRGQWSDNNASPGTARSGGRGRSGRGGFHDNVPAHSPELYYNKSMVEDPWKFLKPVIWKSEESATKSWDSSRSWLPKSISAQRAKASEASSQSKSQPSLAEYLAASFNEAVKNEDNHDVSGI